MRLATEIPPMEIVTLYTKSMVTPLVMAVHVATLVRLLVRGLGTRRTFN